MNETVEIPNSVTKLSIILSQLLLEDGFRLTGRDVKDKIGECAMILKEKVFGHDHNSDCKSLSREEFDYLTSDAIRKNFSAYKRHYFPLLSIDDIMTFDKTFDPQEIMSKDDDSLRIFVYGLSRYAFYLKKLNIDIPLYAKNSKSFSGSQMRVIDEFAGLVDALLSLGPGSVDRMSEQDENKMVETFRAYKEQIKAILPDKDSLSTNREADLNYVCLLFLRYSVNGRPLVEWKKEYQDLASQVLPEINSTLDMAASSTGQDVSITSQMFAAGYIAYWLRSFEKADSKRVLTDRGLLKAAITQDSTAYLTERELSNKDIDAIIFASFKGRLVFKEKEVGKLSVISKCRSEIVYCLINTIMLQTAIDNPSFSDQVIIDYCKNEAQNIVDYFEQCYDGRKPNAEAERFVDLARQKLAVPSFLMQMNAVVEA